MKILSNRLAGVLLAIACGSLAWAGRAEVPASGSPRELYNEGTQKLAAGKLAEAEAYLQSAVASQNEKVQPPALYNLGETRFMAGLEELKKQAAKPPVENRSRAAQGNGEAALSAADGALAGNDLSEMMAAYAKGRGSRKELKAAMDAVKQAMSQYGTVLGKWRSAAGDFSSAGELTPKDADAKANAEFVNRNIARLVDLQQMMMEMMQKLMQQRGDLGKKLQELKKKLPKQENGQNPGKGEDDDDEDSPENPKEPKPGMQEPAHEMGKELDRGLGTEEAERLLGMLKLDANRKLPLGMKDTGEPKKQNRRDW